jgi:hypothetical protein
MIEVGNFETRPDAEFARSLLAGAGIPCVLAPAETTGAYPVDLRSCARLFVADADAHDAAVILRDYAPGEGDHR